MTKVNYAAMSDQELKSYLLNHRDDQEAFYAYMDRRKTRNRDAAIELNDPAWEEKIIALIQKQLDCDR
ncbi:hypothetical protein BCD64_07115 [Nostoc sp. MBR 210]|nr:hypothetical protein BCD64_07115 [Nostoc sp. MBR 210]